jgi:hypothetical protein
MTKDGLTDKNYLWHFMNRELINKGNYMNFDGKCLSVKDFLKDWQTENLYDSLYEDQ